MNPGPEGSLLVVIAMDTIECPDIVETESEVVEESITSDPLDMIPPEPTSESEFISPEPTSEFVSPEPTITPFQAREGEIGVLEPMNISELARSYRVNSLLLKRPLSPQPYQDGNRIIIPSCIAGTKLEVFDISGDEIMGVVITQDDGIDEELEFPSVGDYCIEVTSPLPYLQTKLEFTV